MKRHNGFILIVLIAALVSVLWVQNALAEQAAPPEPGQPGYAESSEPVETASPKPSPEPVSETSEPKPLISQPLAPRVDGAIQIRLQQGVFDPLQAKPKLAQALTIEAYAGDGTGYYLVQFNGPILDEWKAALVEAGAALYDYVPDFAFIVKMDAAVAENVRSLEMVRWAGVYQPAFRLSNELSPIITQADSSKRLLIIARSFTGESAEALAGAFAQLGATILSQGEETGGGTIFQLDIPETTLVNVAFLPGVAWVEPKPKPVLYNAVARSSVAMNKDAVENALGLFGEGQIVVVGDTGFSTGNTATMHPDFQGHFFQGTWGGGTCGTWADANGHGTHVAGSVLGNGVMDGSNPATHSYAGTNAGIAPEALLWGWAFCDTWTGLPDAAPYPDYFSVMYTADARARVNTNSWGYDTSDGSAGTYDAFSRETDRFIWDHPDMVVLFAASNDGTDANSNGVIDPDSMGVPAGSKNIITVGASENYRMSGGYNPGGACSSWGGCWPTDYPAAPINGDLLSNNPSGMVAFSSRGPVDDGRLKPDIVAPGSNIVSTRDDSTTGWGVYNAWYIYMGGTSMAAPLTAGASAIVREFYNDFYGINPTAALVKATLINGAFDMTPGQYGAGATQDVTRRPDNSQGWGRVDLDNSLIYDAPRQLWFYEHTAGLVTAGQYSVVVQTHYATNPFRVSLVWSDRPGLEASNGALINDLDLTVVSSSGTTYRGNDIIGDGLLDGDVDHINNVEGVDLAPGIASYTITVRGYNVPNGPQPFALVVSGDTGGVGILGGTVTDSATGLPVANAQIQAVQQSTSLPFNTTSASNGTYQINLAPAAYDVTASAYGYLPATVNNISITDGATTTQNFALTPASSQIVSGIVTDASTGWPLYAQIDITGYPGSPIFTDPETGEYSVQLIDGAAYDFDVSAVIPGYNPAAATVTLSGSDVTQNFALGANAIACNAPGYVAGSSTLLTNSFEGASDTFPNYGWAQVDVNGIAGNWTAPATGTNPAASPHTGNRLASFNSYTAAAGSSTRLYRSAGIDLSGQTNVAASFWFYHGNCNYNSTDNVQLQISTDGATWNNVGAAVVQQVSGGWQRYTIDVSAFAGPGNTNVRLGLLATSAYGCNMHVDDVAIESVTCTPPAGGLVVGNVYDANTSAGLNGASVSNEDGYSTTSAATLQDPNVADGFYALYSPAGSRAFTAAAAGYTSAVEPVTVAAGGTVRHDFSLVRGFLNYAPSSLAATVPTGSSTVQVLALSNIGTAAASFQLNEIGTNWETMAPLPAGRVFHAVIAAGDYVYVIGGTSDAGGTTATNTNYRYDTNLNTWAALSPMPVALQQVDGAAINGRIYIPGNGTTAITYVYDIAADSWSSIAANGGYSARAQYQVVAIGTNLYVLGGIVGGASTNQVWRLDTTTGTWSAGVAMLAARISFAAAAINGEIFVAGGVTYSAFTPIMTTERFNGTAWANVAGVPTGGGAYTRWSYGADAEGAGKLWLMAGRRDAAWAVLNHAGYYDPMTDSWTTSPTIPTLSQGRVYLEGAMASNGYLYAIGGRNSGGTVIYATNERLAGDLLWLSEAPASGSVPVAGSQAVNVTFDATSLTPGQYTGQLFVSHNTPAVLANIPITLTVVTDYLWNGSVNSNWDTAANWTPNGVPTGFARVTIDPANLTGAAVWPSLNVDANVFGVTLAADAELTIPDGRALTVNGTLVNNGLLRQTRNITSAALTRFLRITGSGGTAYEGVDITPAGAMGQTTVEVRGNQGAGCNDGDQMIHRCFDILPATPQTATVRFWYLEAERNGEDTTAMQAYHWNSTTHQWERLDAAGESRGSAGGYHYIEVDGVSAYSPFGLADGLPVTPTAVTIRLFSASDDFARTALIFIGGFTVLVAGWLLARRRKRAD